MAINKKKDGKVAKPGYPSEFVKLTEEAATFQSAHQYFEARFKEAKEGIESYLSREDCPITINVGEKGSNPKVDGVATVIISQPERLDNKAAAELLVRLLKDGALNPDDLTELVSSVNKEALSKVVDTATLNSLVKKNEVGDVPTQISVRTDGQFKARLLSDLEKVKLFNE